eukprot:m.123840 g.123840  ORF g.123840 m.123840 type:complete len:78 (-) comp12950_c0_seq17:1818-2051(-)
MCVLYIIELMLMASISLFAGCFHVKVFLCDAFDKHVHPCSICCITGNDGPSIGWLDCVRGVCVVCACLYLSVQGSLM